MAGAEARRKTIVEQHMGLVRSLAAKARRSLPASVEYDELVNLGTTGLLEAAERFDPKHGAQFSTFAYYRIRGAIQDGVRHMGWLTRTQWRRHKLQQHSDIYLAELAERDAAARAGRCAAAPAATRAREQAAARLAEALSGVAAVFVTSLEEVAPEGLADDESAAADDVLQQQQTTAAVRGALAKLPEKERHFIEQHYFAEQSLKDAGLALGLSRSWACRLHARAIDLLRDALAEAPPATTAPAPAPAPAAKPARPARPATPATPAKKPPAPRKPAAPRK